MAKIMKETIHANGVDIGIYTSDFLNEYISITDIAFEFASWISPEFKLYIIKDYNIDSAGKISGRKNAAAA